MTFAFAPREARRKVAYILTTSVVVATVTFAGLAEIVRLTGVVESLRHLGYPEYLLYILGPAKLLAVAAIVVPRFPRLKQWAYAGISFDLIGAAASHAFAGEPWTAVAVPLVLLAFTIASWALLPSAKPPRKDMNGTAHALRRAALRSVLW